MRVDVLDMLPTPFGLVRSGVAPDHQKVKSVQNDFMSVAEDERFRFLGNVGIGRDLSVDTLACHYNAVVLAYGAAVGRQHGRVSAMGTLFTPCVCVSVCVGVCRCVSVCVSVRLCVCSAVRLCWAE